MNPFPTEEPSANARAGAQALREMFVALIQSGFTEAQAMNVIGIAVSSAVQKGLGNQE